MKISPPVSGHMSPGAGGVIKPPVTFSSILGSNLLVEFDARYLSSAGSWTDRIRGLEVTPVSTSTTYAADGSNFNGLPVHQCAVSGAAVLKLLAPNPVIWSAGAKPYAFSVCRARTYPAGNAVLGARVLDSSNGINTIMLQTSGGTSLRGIVDLQTAIASFNGTGVHAFEYFDDAAGVTTLAIDGSTVATAGSGGALTNDSGIISFGGTHAGTLPSDSSHALHLFCQTAPTAGQRAQLLALAKSIWGF